jgi:hypothetical protein
VSCAEKGMRARKLVQVQEEEEEKEKEAKEVGAVDSSREKTLLLHG